ncbi:hypothetical protein KAI54_03970 [Candidatus Gracilibacteria bacterium]|nr:hypothetical protein [Candidatus Gracilibacteria bacterium]
MKSKKIPFRQNRKLQFIVVAMIAVLLFLFSWKMEDKTFAAELPRNFNAIEAIKTEVAVVKSARDDYFSAIGKGNGGVYDQHQDSVDCLANLDLRLISLKNLRNDLQRLLGEIGLREREQRIEKSLDFISQIGNKNLPQVHVEKELQVVGEKMLKVMNEIFPEGEIKTLEEEEAKAELAFRQSTARLENCMEIYDNLEKCESEFENWIEQWMKYQGLALELKNTLTEKALEAETKLAPFEKQFEEIIYKNDENNSPTRLEAFLRTIQAKNLKADTTSSDDPWYVKASKAGAAGGSAVGTAIGGAVSTVISPITGLVSGATGALSSGISAVATALGTTSDALGGALAGITISTTVLDGPGAADGLVTFKKNYEGNKYGSAIGMITGWTNFMLPFVGALAIAALVYAGFLYLTAAGNEEQTGKAKKIIIWVVIGIIVIFSAYAIVNTLLESDSSKGTGTEGGTSIDVSIGGIDFSWDN